MWLAGRGGAAAVEAALVLPVLFFLTCGLVVGGTYVFRHQQVACLAREAARWASVRGGQYQKETSQASPTRQQIVDQAVLPLAVGMDPAAVGVRVSWVDKGAGTAWDWDAASKDIRSITASGEYISNTVQVTVTYQVYLGIFFGPATVQSVCEIAMSN